MEKTTLDIMLPVYCGNLHEIEESIEKQIPFFTQTLPQYNWKIVLAINGKNPEEIIKLAENMNKKYPHVAYSYVEQPGKGSGIISAWSKSDATILSYMDIDLATNLHAFSHLIAQIQQGYDLSIGSRYHPQSRVQRSFKRKFISIFYHKLFMKIFLGAKDYTDAQCGFKAINQNAARTLLPLLENKNWFFESELLYLAQRKGFKIKEVPVTWTESPFSGLNLSKAIAEFIRCSFKLRFRKI